MTRRIDEMVRMSGSLLVFALFLLFSDAMIHVRPAMGEPVQAAEKASGSSIKYHGYEAVIGVTSRAQTLLVFEGTGSNKLAVMTGKFVPYPQLFITTPFHSFKDEDSGSKKNTRSGYYWKYSYNRFSLDGQEDPDTGGIGSSSHVYNYGTKVEGNFFAVAPVIATEMLRPDETVKLRLELGLGLGYLDLDGDVVLGDWQGDPLAPVTQVDYSGLSFFVFTMGRYNWGRFMFGSQLGISATSSKPYSFSQSYVSLDIGYRMVL
ncbi:MAG: hypothetical protein PVJ01_00365 [Pseudomonadota bacterium]